MIPALVLTTALHGNLNNTGDWFHQNGQDCVEAASEIAIRETTGHRYSQSRIEAYAQRRGWYVPGVGTHGATAIPDILTHYGVRHVQAQAPRSLATVATDLDRGREVIAIVDGPAIWNALGGRNVDNGQPDHVVLVDEVNTAAGVVVVTDTGVVGGAELVVPIGVFKRSWATSGYLTDVAW